MKLRIFAFLLFLIPALVLVPVALAQDPTPAPTEEPQFPTEPPEIPDTLPENPQDVIPLLEVLIMFGAGLLAKYLTDVSKALPFVGGSEKFRKQIIQAVAVLASLAVTVVTTYAGVAAEFLQSSGLWAVLLAVLTLQFGAHRGEKLFRQIGARLLHQTFTSLPVKK